MKPFVVHTGIAAPLDRVNVDTDAIIPKQFLKRIERTGFGQFLFYEWRFNADGSPIESFVLNQPKYAGATVLLARNNFGCGSSREHAPWALLDYGFRAIIAPSFADIFYNNCFKNGILPIKLSEDQVQELFSRATTRDNYQLTIDLKEQLITDGAGLSYSFEVDEYRRYCLLNGLDDIGITLQYEDKIAAYEAKRETFA
ncbi:MULTISPECIES: 3-isopropylmalate dehydratase small subunit [Bacillales]|jgi:3-isopropylmalate/(R)-2-methylmalate dehydratase small subunit|uniref:3-isopropylmalate dehydratase small subunit n=1 Tax=Brevibacillus aydinogluensis TaxID=927786 RepID=A0AA48MAR5_9BACL|nr:MULTISPECIES: 3-isopropylmalate dehydratase small subunit [Bacillales]REK62168.1 MAG: 3-isopropylmalate dehydratase small subunit [Brevibacillus sp.]MBR8658489.1 3-isopropylmalate dehydratase small subunit [Brevibacillus sp. NL20B1]MDT3415441.1 3-isopropylmalate/(R)-2-methylmalate dehydratase small subunit [Brevibacillus aydinogluensis]NNV02083.1 3-isopropylmalate dehydratase small subunit [Brevibacillus sp. MCWH]UFJ60522.1 3-isopropylmalate dehydratase small subunit [Anoxybacillus sedimini